MKPRLSAAGTLTASLIILASTSCGGASSTPSTKATSAPAQLTASGDIPDTATYLVFHDRHYSLEYVEGWVQTKLPSNGVRFSDKDSSETLVLKGAPPSSISAFARGPGVTETSREFRRFSKPLIKLIALPAGPAAKLSFRAMSSPDPVTGKRVPISVDRYYISPASRGSGAGPRRLAVLTLATPVGVDNVDAFRRFAHSFTWTGK